MNCLEFTLWDIHCGVGQIIVVVVVFFNKLYCQQYYDITYINNSTVRTVVLPADRSSQWDRWPRRLSAVAPSNLTSLKHGAGIRAIE